jgi:hypothetical protein
LDKYTAREADRGFVAFRHCSRSAHANRCRDIAGGRCRNPRYRDPAITSKITIAAMMKATDWQDVGPAVSVAHDPSAAGIDPKSVDTGA